MENANEPATKEDIALLRSGTKEDLALLRSETKEEIALLRSGTKEDLALLRSETKEDIALLRSETKENLAMLRSEMQHLHDDVIETMRDVQTELLKAFYNYAQTTDIKLKDGEAADFMARQRLTAAESRITEIEKRLNMPPTN